MAEQSPLGDTYRKYKAGTNTIAKWLVRAARTCSASVPQFTPIDSTNCKKILSIDQFLELANVVASQCDARLNVEPRVLNTLREVIQLRRTANRFFQQHSGPQSSSRSDQNHVHFITVLETVLKALTDAKASSDDRSWTLPAKTSLNEAPSSQLEQQQTSDSEIVEEADHVAQVGAAGTGSGAERSPKQSVLRRKKKRTKAKSKSKSQVSGIPTDDDFELDTSTDELYVMLFYFFKDLNETREYISGLWRRYAAGELTLIAAAVTTDLAFDCVNQRETELLNSQVVMDGRQTTFGAAFEHIQKISKQKHEFSRYWRYTDGKSPLLDRWCLGDLLFDYLYDLGERQTLESKLDQDKFDDMMYRLADWLCLTGYAWLDVFIAAEARPQGGDVRLPQAMVEHESGPAAARLKNRFDTDFYTAFLLLDWTAFHAAHDEFDGPPRDRWTQSILSIIHKSFRVTGRVRYASLISTSLIWSTTVAQDIPWYIGEYSHNAYEELRQHALAVRDAVAEFQRWQSRTKRRTEAWSHKAMHMMKMIIETYIENDIVGEIDKVHLTPEEVARKPHVPYFLLYKSPIWCGVLLFWIKITMWRISMELESASVTIGSTCHLYNAAMQENKSTPRAFEWQDLEYVMQLHGVEHLFIGGRPENAVQYDTRLMLAMGMAPADATLKSRRREPCIRTENRRLLRADALICHALVARYWMSVMDVEQKDVHQEVRADTVLITMYNRQEASKRTAKYGRDLYLVPLLDNACTVLGDEWKHLQFDYTGLHLRCHQLLDRLHARLPNDICEINDDHSIAEVENEVFLLPMKLIAHLADSERPPSTARVRRFGALARDALSVVAEFAEEEGAEGIIATLLKLKRNLKFMKSAGSEVEMAAGSESNEDDQSLAVTKTKVKTPHNNRNKNKNRKARQKALRATRGSVDELDTEFSIMRLTPVISSSMPYAIGNDLTMNRIDALQLAKWNAMGFIEQEDGSIEAGPRALDMSQAVVRSC